MWKNFPDILTKLKLGIECFTKVHNIKGHYYYIKVWDTCGQERFRSLTANYYRNSDGIVLVFDISNPDTFDNLKNWIKSLHENTAENIPKIIVCNKIDLENIITQSQINSFSKEYNIQIYQSSAKANTNVVEPFDYIIKDVLNHKKNKNNRITLNASNEGSALGCNC